MPYNVVLIGESQMYFFPIHFFMSTEQIGVIVENTSSLLDWIIEEIQFIIGGYNYLSFY